MKYLTVTLISLLAVSSQLHAADVKDIYHPDIRTAHLEQNEAIDVHHGSWGVGVVYQSQENLAARMGLNLNGRWFASERWYLLGEYQYAPFNTDEISSNGSVLLESGETANVLAGGVGYSFMQGSASFSGLRSYPWQVALELLSGQQMTGDTSGRYTGAGLSWQVMSHDYWFAAGWRLYSADDSRLKNIDVNAGAQWGISFGSWF